MILRMSRMVLVSFFAILIGLGCSKREPAPSTSRTYEIKIYEDAEEVLDEAKKAALPTVKIRLQQPVAWREDPESRDGGPRYTFPWEGHGAITVIPTKPGTPEERVAEAFERNYGDGVGAQREALSYGDRLWVTRVEKGTTHARLFLPISGGVIMGLVFLEKPTDAQLAEVKAAFETMQVAH